MGKSQTRRLREATQRFGREDWSRWINARANLSALVQARKAEAGITTPTVAGPTSSGPTFVKRYCSSLTHEQNELRFGKPWK